MNHLGTKDFLAWSLIIGSAFASRSLSSSFEGGLGGGGGRIGAEAEDFWSCNRSISKHLVLSSADSSTSSKEEVVVVVVFKEKKIFAAGAKPASYKDWFASRPFRFKTRFGGATKSSKLGAF